jgi:hypothetical protein
VAVALVFGAVLVGIGLAAATPTAEGESTATEASVSEEWETRVSDSSFEDQVSVEVSEGTVFVVNGSSVFGVDPATGDEAWERRLAEGGLLGTDMGRTTAATAGVVFVEQPGGTNNPQKLLALDGDDGSTLWERESRNDVLAAQNNRLLRFQLAASGRTFVPEVDAYDAETGTEEWSTQFDSLSSDLRGEPPLIDMTLDDGSVIAGVSQGTTAKVFSLDLSSGTIEWETSVTGIAPEVAGDGDSIYVITDDSSDPAETASENPDILTTIDAETGDTTNEVTLPDQGLDDPVAGEGNVYVSEAFAAVAGERLRGYEASSGDRILNQTSTTDNREGYSRPTVVNGTLYIADGLNGLDVIDTGDGSVITEIAEGTEASQSEAPAVDGSSVYTAGNFDGATVRKFDVSLPDGGPDTPTDTPTPDTPTDTPAVGTPPSDVPAVVGSDKPTDTDGDDVFEDIDGNGNFDIFDIQALFQNLQSSTIQNNAAGFNFDNSGGVDIFDVQKLFQELQTNQ